MTAPQPTDPRLLRRACAIAALTRRTPDERISVTQLCNAARSERLDPDDVLDYAQANGYLQPAPAVGR